MTAFALRLIGGVYNGLLQKLIALFCGLHPFQQTGQLLSGLSLGIFQLFQGVQRILLPTNISQETIQFPSSPGNELSCRLIGWQLPALTHCF